MTEPTTKAGRALLARLSFDSKTWRGEVVAIEAEAREQEWERIAPAAAEVASLGRAGHVRRRATSDGGKWMWICREDDEEWPCAAVRAAIEEKA